MGTVEGPAGPQVRQRRYLELARQSCIIDPNRITIRPSPAAFVPPSLGLVIGCGCFALIVADVIRWGGALPFGLLALLLVGCLVLIPLSTMGLVYGAIGSSVVIDRHKQSITWQQGLLGLGVGTRELVPFWQIEAITVDEEGADEGMATEEFAQWQIDVVKKNGRRLTLGQVQAPRSLARPSLDRAVEAARAIAELTAAPLQVTARVDSIDASG